MNLPHARHKKMNFLAIEDDQTVIKLYEKFLAEEGHTLVSATTGADGIKKMDGGAYDLIFMDLKLPDMDGMDLVRRVKDKLEWMPVIIVTANPTLESSIEAVNIGIVTEYIVKPFDSQELVLVIDKAVEKAKLAIENKRLLKKLEISNKALTERVEELEDFAKMAVEYKEKVAKLNTHIQALQAKLKTFEEKF